MYSIYFAMNWLVFWLKKQSKQFALNHSGKSKRTEGSGTSKKLGKYPNTSSYKKGQASVFKSGSALKSSWIRIQLMRIHSPAYIGSRTWCFGLLNRVLVLVQTGGGLGLAPPQLQAALIDGGLAGQHPHSRVHAHHPPAGQAHLGKVVILGPDLVHCLASSKFDSCVSLSWTLRGILFKRTWRGRRVQ